MRNLFLRLCDFPLPLSPQWTWAEAIDGEWRRFQVRVARDLEMQYPGVSLVWQAARSSAQAAQEAETQERMVVVQRRAAELEKEARQAGHSSPATLDVVRAQSQSTLPEPLVNSLGRPGRSGAEGDSGAAEPVGAGTGLPPDHVGIRI